MSLQEVADRLRNKLLYLTDELMAKYPDIHRIDDDTFHLYHTPEEVEEAMRLFNEAHDVADRWKAHLQELGQYDEVFSDSEDS